MIFTRGTTESINLVASSFGEAFVHPGDEIIVSQLEHHSNFVPWFELCRRKGARFRVLPFTADGELDPEVLKGMFTEKTRLLALNQVSNSLGTVNPLETIIPLAHANGVPVLVDAAQSVQHSGRARRASPGRGLLRFFRAQNVRPDGHWSFVCQRVLA